MDAAASGRILHRHQKYSSFSQTGRKLEHEMLSPEAAGLRVYLGYFNLIKNHLKSETSTLYSTVHKPQSIKFVFLSLNYKLECPGKESKIIFNETLEPFRQQEL